MKNYIIAFLLILLIAFPAYLYVQAKNTERRNEIIKCDTTSAILSDISILKGKVEMLTEEVKYGKKDYGQILDIINVELVGIENSLQDIKTFFGVKTKQ